MLNFWRGTKSVFFTVFLSWALACQCLPAGATKVAAAASATAGATRGLPEAPAGTDGFFSQPTEATPKPQGDVTIEVRVPHNKRPVDHFTAYPYPVKPPPAAPINPLPTADKSIKALLLQSGYTGRSANTRPYPTVHGWRWQYAYHAALRRSGLGVPHLLFGIYSWTNKMLPYIKPEIERLNEGEKQRRAKYEQALADHEKNFVEMENEAIRNGLYPVEVKTRIGRGKAALPAGTWWISGTHKVPGLTYYWQMPVTITAGQQSHLNLTEDNALVIQGGW